MAAAQIESCEICMKSFTDYDRKAVALPCGHDFCLTCLVRLKTAGSRKCPKCRGDWAELEVQALPGMALDTEAQGEEEDDLLAKLLKGNDRCRKHELAYDFWSRQRKDFYCKKCVIELGLSISELQLIDDAVPMIKADIGDRVVEANEQLEEDSKAVNDFHDDCSKVLKFVSNFREQFQKLEEKLKESITNAEILRAKRFNDSVLANKVNKEKEKIKSEADISIMVSSRATLDSLKQPCVLPVLQEQESLLCNIAGTYMENAGTDELHSSASLISGLMKATGNSALPLKKAALDAGELKEKGVWIVDSTNCLAALLALTDRQPSLLRLTSSLDEPEVLPAAAFTAVVQAARDCDIRLALDHSFVRPEHHGIDQELLEHILTNPSLSLTHFFGHLEAANIAKLPTTVTHLGLVISSAAIATAVSGLKPWDKLDYIHVSVSSTVDACDLSELPSVGSLDLHFPGLTDARVDSVRPAIEALVPEMKFDGLVFPLSQLTAAGTHRLMQQLRGAWIDEVTIKPSGPWRPRQAEKERLEVELRRAVGCRRVDWNMNRLH